ncbi:uncharacterized protein LOC116222886, partial [Tachysurus ichikawai]
MAALVSLLLRPRAGFLMSSQTPAILTSRPASKKSGGSSKNLGGKSPGHRYGFKKQDGDFVRAGNILATQRLMRWHPGAHLLKPFLHQVSRAYITCAKYLQKKLSLQSKTLQCLSAIGPVVRGRSQTGFELKKLTQMLSHMLPPDADTHQEILHYSVDQELPTFTDGDDIVSWWASVFETGKYPGLSQAVKAALSIFHGPLVESSFNL